MEASINAETIMTRIVEFCERMIRDEVIQLSGGVFVDHVRKDGTEIKANITPEDFCTAMGNLNNMTAEEYADIVLNTLDSPMQRIVGECPQCFAFLIEGEIHDNCKDVVYKIPAKNCSECGCDGIDNEIISYEGKYLCNECAKYTGNAEL